ncbi:hypothetical protein ZIOFF_011645 [Zingiber officinale]|uniref:Uncharacterized protein n=1 Tax=Zingiber officinale TaxID=94328 RepID=A0A8J5I6E2_ZINOF|nr:hypothetical protein ZIOFF_011645 [Zingiber officinale]
MEQSKQIGDEEAEAQRPKPEVTDEEVDEFFSILRRVHAISKTFAGKGSGTMAGAEETNTKAAKRKKPARQRADVEGRKATSRWRPTFILEDFRVAGEADAAASSETADLTLDLDSEAVSEDVRVSATSSTDDGVICDDRLISGNGRFSIGKLLSDVPLSATTRASTRRGGYLAATRSCLTVARRCLAAARTCLAAARPWLAVV